MNTTAFESMICDRYKGTLHQWDIMFLFICTIMAIIFIIATSSMLIYGLVKTNKLLSITSKIFIYISICDLVNGFIVIPIQLLNMALKLPCLLAVTQDILHVIIISMSLYTLITLTVLRYIAINNPLRKIKNRTVHIVLFIGLMLSIANASAYFYTSHKQELLILMGILLFLIAVIIMTFLMVSISLNIILRRSLRKRSCAIKKSIRSKMHMVSKEKATTTLLILLVVILICYLPTVIATGYTAYHILAKNENYYLVWHRSARWSTYVYSLASGFNSLVYMLRTKSIRKFYATTFRCNSHSLGCLNV